MAEPSSLAGLPHITYTDLAVISLTAVGVIVAATAVILGALAFFGWASIKDSASSQAREAGKKAVDDHLKSPEFHAKLREIASAEIEEQIKKRITVTISKPKSGGRRGGTGRTAPFEG